MKREIEREAYTIPETAESLGTSETTIWRWIKQGVLPSIRLGGRTLVPRDGLRECLQSWRPKTEQPRKERKDAQG